MPQNPMHSPSNELKGIKRPSSVLVRGFSAREIAANSGLIPPWYSDEQFIAWLQQPATDAADATAAALAAIAAAQAQIGTVATFETTGTGLPQTFDTGLVSLSNTRVHLYYNGLIQPISEHTTVTGVVTFTAPVGYAVTITVS